ncbi:MAG: hypothetical protein AAF587_44515, partial [Bacteroidota bacterium]
MKAYHSWDELSCRFHATCLYHLSIPMQPHTRASKKGRQEQGQPGNCTTFTPPNAAPLKWNTRPLISYSYFNPAPLCTPAELR